MMMKTATKLFGTALFAITLFANANLKAQDMTTMGNGLKLKIGVGASAAITNSNSPFSYGVGADVRAQLWLAPTVAVTASGGYTRLIPKENSIIAAYSFIPAVGGVKVYPIKGMFLQGFLGAGFAIKDDQETSFIFGGGTGYEWNNGLEISVRYEGNQQDSSSITYQPIISQYALRIGYNF
jgi:opacity protein-like surface antigen